VLDSPEDVAAVRAVLDRWVALLESGQVDSAAALTTSDCVFSYGGRRYTVSESLRGFRTLQDFRVRLDSVVTHVRGDVAYVVYSDEGSFKAEGVATTSREVGGIVFVRETGIWRIAQWTATSPPTPTVP
jgi:ketosteroid isomerase-like protein